ncbi:hypothetical protein, partial [Rhodothermus marinus]|uniref:hypothetical protein n=1 Tax=Rhodothermus marinus TaxID=29549 RepID=UPI000B014F0C
RSAVATSWPTPPYAAANRTRRDLDVVRRERFCRKCHLHFLTTEHVEAVLLYRPRDRATVRVAIKEFRRMISDRT